MSGAQVQGAWSVLLAGLRNSPELRAGALYTIAFAIAGAVGSLLVPILTQQIVDHGLLSQEGFRPAFVYAWCGIGAALIAGVYVAARAARVRLVARSENALRDLRVQTFAHIHRLSIAEQTSVRRGEFVSRVTADVDTLSDFMEWAAITWITSTTLVLGSAVVMLVYSWQLALVAIVVVGPLVLVLRRLQRGLLAAYDDVRTRVAELLTEISESLMGAALIRAYGIAQRIDQRIKRAIRRQYEAQMRANRYQAVIFPVSDVFGGVATAAVLGVGVWLGPAWGMSAGDLVAFLFLVGLFLQPVGELSETFDHTQTAIAAWRKVLRILDMPVDLVEPIDGVELPPGALSLRAESVYFSYRDGGPVLSDVSADVPAGSHIAIVGETGCGKTTFAKLLCRLADPTSGRVVVGGVDLREVAPDSRRRAIRMVPQDGFLFDATVRANVRQGSAGATDDHVEAAFAELGLQEWLSSLPDGLDTRVGQRGENLSVGERQFVALARAQIANPGVLILDEAMSSIDPEAERALADALQRVSRGRTTITIAHRLATAEAADLVLVFDKGRIVERGRHDQLARAGGVYARLYESWLGNVAARPEQASAGR